MGGAVSSGSNNDDLIDNLLEADYIKTSQIERVFRAVDRAEYFLPEARMNAYKDLAWKCGNLHLSAPCIYSEVMEGLRLSPGLSFLNLGSGTGYLSTMVGLVLGSNGINHGVEIHKDVILYANKKLEDFKKFSGAIDEFDFCAPKFIQGNCLCLTSDCYLYDRVYCGAACPEHYETYMKNLIKIGGILVMPLNEQLLQIKRTSETNWEVQSLLPVSFASLIQPLEDKREWIQMVEIEPSSLQSICRSVVRNILRKNIECEHPPVKRVPPVNKAPKKKRALRRLVVPLFESDDSSEEERHVRLGDRNRDAGRATFREESDNLLNFVLGTIRERRNIFSGDRQAPMEQQDCAVANEPNKTDTAMETDTNESTDENEKNIKVETQVQAVIEHNPRSESQSQNENADDTLESIHDVLVNVLNEVRREINEEISNEENDHHDAEPAQVEPSSSNQSESTSRGKREKFDSGLGDEIVESHTPDTSDDEDGDMKLEVISSSDEEEEDPNRRSRRSLKSRPRNKSSRFVNETNSSSDNDKDEQSASTEMRMYESQYTEYMKCKIQELPLPPILKRYLNFYREF